MLEVSEIQTETAQSEARCLSPLPTKEEEPTTTAAIWGKHNKVGHMISRVAKYKNPIEDKILFPISNFGNMSDDVLINLTTVCVINLGTDLDTIKHNLN